MLQSLLSAFFALVISVISLPGLAQSPFGNGDQQTAQHEFLPVEEAYQLHIDLEGQDLSLLWTIAPDYYLYRERFQLHASNDSGTIPLSPQFEQGKIKYDEYFEKDVESYYLSTEINATIPTDVQWFNLVVTSQGCADAGLCYPPYKHYFRIDVETGAVTPQAPPASSPSHNQSADNTISTNTTMASTAESAFLPYILLLAILGGAVLNLMPCVFPVLSIKALSLASASQSPHQQHMHGWVYTLGVVISFVAIAAAMLAIRAGGQAVGWGFQLQSPVFVSFLAYLFFVMGLSLSGLIDFGTRFMGLGQSLVSGSGMRSSFFTGVLAAVVASPCTAPLMGTALGYAMTQPAAVALLVFGALGFGMALPFLLISYIPDLTRRLPAPGAWMESLKQLMAFPLYLAAIWLLWILGHQVSSDAVAMLSVGGVLIAFALWLARLPISSMLSRYIRGAAVMSLTIVACAIPFKAQSPAPQDHWEPYSPDRLTELRSEGKPVLVNLTADWCITCLANEKIALDTQEVNTALAIHDIYTLKGDWTNYNPEITKLLNSYGRNGVPLYLVFPPRKDADAEILPQLLTQDIVLDAIQRIAPTQTAQN